MKKYIIRIFAILLFLICMHTLANITVEANGWDEQITEVKIPSSEAKIINAFNRTLGISKYIGLAVAFIILIYLGIKFITDSPDGKAEIKKNLTVYVIGVILLFSVVGVVTIIETISGEMMKVEKTK